MSEAFSSHLRAVLAEIDAAGLLKRERLIASPQGGRIRIAGPQGEREMVNLCANNYLGLADHPEMSPRRRSRDGRRGRGNCWRRG